MILEDLRDLSLREGLLANPDFEPRPVAWIIVVGDGGRFLNLEPTIAEGDDGKKPRAKVFSIPRRVGRTSSAVADFLVDKSEYVLGVHPDGKRKESDLAARKALFARSVSEAAHATGAPALAAVESFLRNDSERDQAVKRVSSLGFKSNDLFAFEYNGRLVHELPDAQEYFSKTRTTASLPGVQCLICGSTKPPVDKHPTVKIPGGTSSGISLVSFNSDAFESYGLSRNENASVCRDCADGYTTALNRLLSDRYPDPRHPGEVLPKRYVRLCPDTTAVFWATEETSVVDLFARYFEAPTAEAVAALIKSPYVGMTRPEMNSRFYCLILSGAQGRAVIRSAHTDTVQGIENNLRRYFESIEIEPQAPLPLWMLMRSLVLQGKLENLSPGFVTDIFMAIVFGNGFPHTLLSSAVNRCRAERKVTRERAACLRAYLRRNNNVEVSVGLDKNNKSAGYRLGRLMAVLERVQTAAQNNPNKTIVDRYYGAASTRPGIVFPRLIAMAQHHAAKLTGGLQAFYQSRLGEVIDGIGAFPTVLNMEEQGLFALGYYHQRQEFFKKSGAEDDGEKGAAA